MIFPATLAMALRSSSLCNAVGHDPLLLLLPQPASATLSSWALVVAGVEGMEKEMGITIMAYIGTTARIHSCIASLTKASITFSHHFFSAELCCYPTQSAEVNASYAVGLNSTSLERPNGP